MNLDQLVFNDLDIGNQYLAKHISMGWIVISRIKIQIMNHGDYELESQGGLIQTKEILIFYGPIKG